MLHSRGRNDPVKGGEHGKVTTDRHVVGRGCPRCRRHEGRVPRGRFNAIGLAMIAETGRADFTVLEVVERSKTSLRAFYQHYTTKDDLLLALIGKIMAESADRWRTDTAGLTAPAARRWSIERIGRLRVQHPGQHQSRPDLLERSSDGDPSTRIRPGDDAPARARRRDPAPGIADGDFRGDLEIETTAAIVMQTALGALRLRSLSANSRRPGRYRDLDEFCRRSLGAAHPVSPVPGVEMSLPGRW